MKKFVFFPFIFSLLWPCLLFGLETDINAGYFSIYRYASYAALEAYTDGMVLAGYTADIVESTGIPGINLNLSAGFRGPVDVYSRIVYAPSLIYNASYSVPLTGQVVYSRQYSAFQLYGGLGLRLQLLLFGNCRFFAGADAGCLVFSDKTTDIFEPDGVSYSSSVIAPYFAYAASAGMKIYMGTNMYIGFEAGYSGFSGGFSAGCGLGYDFAGLEKPAVPAGRYMEKALLYEKNGDKYYAQRNYKNALPYFIAAVKLNKNAMLCIKAGNCYYMQKKYKDAIGWYEYSLKLKDNPKLRALVAKIKKTAPASRGGK